MMKITTKANKIVDAYYKIRIIIANMKKPQFR